MKVLLVDDSNTMRKIQRRVLNQMGIEDIAEAGNGIEAMKVIAETPARFDLILCDINMPECDGLETLKRLRQNPACVDIPVIMCTSVAEKDQVMKALKSGANNYVVKPFRPEDLQKKIEATVTIRKTDVTAPAAPPAAATP